MNVLSKPQVPLLLHSSKSLGWNHTMVVNEYLEPDQIEWWCEPVSPDIHVTVLTRGAMDFQVLRGKFAKKQTIAMGDAILMPPEGLSSPVGWTRLSLDVMHTTHIFLSYAFWRHRIEELLDRDSNTVNLSVRAFSQDLLLLNVAQGLERELAHPTSLSKICAETALDMIVVHLLRHYTTGAISVPIQQNKLSQEQLRQVTDYIHACLAEDLSLTTLAGLVNFSRYHFARLFRLTMGETVHQYVLRQRLQQAQRLLTTTKTTIAQIALDTGFVDQSHLTHAFRRQFRLTPSAYREMYRQQ